MGDCDQSRKEKNFLSPLWHCSEEENCFFPQNCYLLTAIYYLLLKTAISSKWSRISLNLFLWTLPPGANLSHSLHPFSSSQLFFQVWFKDVSYFLQSPKWAGTLRDKGEASKQECDYQHWGEPNSLQISSAPLFQRCPESLHPLNCLESRFLYVIWKRFQQLCVQSDNNRSEFHKELLFSSQTRSFIKTRPLHDF